MKHDGARLTPIDSVIGSVLERFRAKLKAGGFEGSALSGTAAVSEPVCPLCNGFGWVSDRSRFGGSCYEAVAVPCACKSAEIAAQKAKRFAKWSMLDDPRFGSWTFGTLPEHVHQRAALVRARWYLYHPSGMLTLIGEPGSGKTAIAAALGRELRSRMREVIMRPVPELLDRLRAGLQESADEDFDQLFERLCTVEVLILDDLGAEGSTQWVEEKLLTLVNHRYNSQLLTVVTSNIPLTKMPERISSRLCDMSTNSVVYVGGRDLRSGAPYDQRSQDLYHERHGIWTVCSACHCRPCANSCSEKVFDRLASHNG